MPWLQAVETVNRIQSIWSSLRTLFIGTINQMMLFQYLVRSHSCILYGIWGWDITCIFRLEGDWVQETIPEKRYSTPYDLPRYLTTVPDTMQALCQRLTWMGVTNWGESVLRTQQHRLRMIPRICTGSSASWLSSRWSCDIFKCSSRFEIQDFYLSRNYRILIQVA